MKVHAQYYASKPCIPHQLHMKLGVTLETAMVQDGMLVTFSEVNGMEELNDGKPRKVKKCKVCPPSLQCCLSLTVKMCSLMTAGMWSRKNVVLYVLVHDQHDIKWVQLRQLSDLTPADAHLTALLTCLLGPLI